MKSAFTFCLLILFTLTISYNAIIQFSNIIGLDQVEMVCEKLSDESKSEDSEKENQEVQDDFFFIHTTSIEFFNHFQHQISELETKNNIHFLSHSHIEEIYSPPDFNSCI